MNRMKVWAPGVLTLCITAAGFAAPVVEISKTCPSLRYLGRNASFEITVTNRGDSPASNVVVTDRIPAGIDFVSADNNGSRQSNQIVWRVGTLEPGKSQVVTAKFRCNTIGKFKNSATVSYCADMSDECELEVKGIPAILLECVDNPDPIEINTNVTYSIDVTNQGSAVGTNIVIECTLPAEQRFVSADGPTKATVEGQIIRFAPIVSLAPKNKGVYKVTVKGIGEGDVRFRVEMTSDQIGEPVMETESTNIYQ